MNEENMDQGAAKKSPLDVFTAGSSIPVREKAAIFSPYVHIERSGAAGNDEAPSETYADRRASGGARDNDTSGESFDERERSLTAAGWERVCSGNVPQKSGFRGPPPDGAAVCDETPPKTEDEPIRYGDSQPLCADTPAPDPFRADTPAHDTTRAADAAVEAGLPVIAECDPAKADKRRWRAAVSAILAASSVAAFVCAGAFVADAISQFGKAALYSGFASAPTKAPSENKAAPEGSPTSEAPSPDYGRASVDQTAPEGDAEESVSFPIEHISMAPDDPFEISNMTEYVPDVAALTSVAAFAAAAPSPSDGPAVLVIHTHSTEAYAAQGAIEYNEQVSFRSADTSENIVAVGDELCAGLEAAGVEAIHCTRIFDTEDFEHAYDRTAAAVLEYLETYPSIRLVLDVHRDAVFRPDGTLLAPTTSDGAAQVMIVCGTDELGADFPGWRDNLSFAFAVQAAAKARYGDLMRGVNLRGASFNEQLAERYLLVEVGSAGNTLDEAKAGARRFAEALAAAMG